MRKRWVHLMQNFKHAWSARSFWGKAMLWYTEVHPGWSWTCVKESWLLAGPLWKWVSLPWVSASQGEPFCMPSHYQMGSWIQEGKLQVFRTWHGLAGLHRGCVMNQGQTYYLSHLWNQQMETSNKSKYGKKLSWETSTMSSKMKMCLSCYIHELFSW